ncbi:MAG: hypothetical protein P8123_05190, partial [bacterium]
MMTKHCLKVALFVLLFSSVLYCLPVILPGENGALTPGEYPASDSVEFASEDTLASSDELTITTYYIDNGYYEGHLITFPDSTTMSIDCADGDTTTKSHFHDDH